MIPLPPFRLRTLLTFCATWALRRMRPGKPGAVFLLCLLLTGCTIGPTVEVRHVFIHPGQPLKVMKNVRVSGERLDGGGAIEHDVGGWVMMPPSHWAAIETLIKQMQAPQPVQPGK